MTHPSQTALDSSRLFLALWPQPDVRKALQQWRDNWTWPSKAWLVRPESLHLTLHFLGNVPSARLPELVQGLRVPFDPFDLALGRTQTWPNGVAVLEPDAIPVGLHQLHSALGGALRRLAIPIEARAYRPHVTFARRAHGAVAPTGGVPVQWSARDYALVESQPAPPGGYRVLQAYACRP